MIDKDTIRERVLYVREKELSESERRLKNLSITEKFIHEFLLPAGVDSLGLYYPIRNEVDTLELFRFCLENGIRCYFPKITRLGEMKFYPVNDESELKKGKYGIYEPGNLDANGEDGEPPGVLVVPLVAFDAENYRIGYGKGYYDRYISEHNPLLTIGFAYSFQKVEGFPVDSWDVRLDLVLTENGWHGEMKKSMSGGSR